MDHSQKDLPNKGQPNSVPPETGQQRTEKSESANQRSQPHSWTEDLCSVLAEEQQWIHTRRKAVNLDPDAPPIGLALSGGGIRSATFNLGVLECLSRHQLLGQVDYLSTVSGGGYIGSCFAWVRSQQAAGSEEAFTETQVKGSSDRKASCHTKETLLDWLRGHGDYLIAGRGFSLWQLLASILAGTLLNLIVMLPVFLWALYLLGRDIGDFAWPVWLHLSGAPAIEQHDGYLLLLLLGFCSLGLYFISVLWFALSSAFPFFRPLSKHYFIRKWMGRLLAMAVGLMIVGLLPVMAGFEHWFAQLLEDESYTDLGRELSWSVPLLSGTTVIWRGVAGKGKWLTAVGISLLALSFFIIIYHLANHSGLMDTAYMIGWTSLSLVLAATVNVNAISMHSYYCGRLALAYLPKLKQMDKSDTEPMDFPLADLSAKYGAPLPIINTTINTSSSALQKLRSRKGENFFLSPLYSGSTHTGFILTRQYQEGKLALSTAFSASGAAVDPNTFATSSRPIAFLMALLNFRLGYWADNPRTQGQGSSNPSWYRLMLREMLAYRLDERQSKIHLSDGGHFENLGLYELFRRRVPLIIVGDAGADAEGTFADLGKAIQRARADFGVEVEIDLEQAPKPTELAPGCRCLRGRVKYPKTAQQPPIEGHILYLKSALRSPLSADVFSYWRQNPQFPDQSTSDQFFDERQFDAYRQLGYQLTKQLIKGRKHLTQIIESE